MTATGLFDLSGKVALVTGAGRGLGLAIATGLAQAGAQVVLNGRDRASLEAAAAAIGALGGKASIASFDITDAAEAERQIAALHDVLGRLDILVNNVGQRARADLFSFTLAEVRDLLEVDLVAPLHLSRTAARLMQAEGWGRIINITSIAGQIARSGDAVYTAAKNGLAGLTRALAAELGPSGITVNAIAPGFFATEANAAMTADPAVSDWLDKRSSLGRWGAPSEIAGAAVFLASEAASYVTGQVIAVDGGYLAHF